MFSFVIDVEHVMIINDVECVTLGHNFTEDPVVAHPYFGTQRVIEDLSAAPFWATGEVTLPPNPLLRDPLSGLICGISPAALLTSALLSRQLGGGHLGRLSFSLSPLPASPSSVDFGSVLAM